MFFILAVKLRGYIALCFLQCKQKLGYIFLCDLQKKKGKRSNMDITIDYALSLARKVFSLISML